jgi:hypothetical protein
VNKVYTSKNWNKCFKVFIYFICICFKSITGILHCKQPPKCKHWPMEGGIAGKVKCYSIKLPDDGQKTTAETCCNIKTQVKVTLRPTISRSVSLSFEAHLGLMTGY